MKVQKNLEKLGSHQLTLILLMICEGTGGKLEKNGKDLERRIRAFGGGPGVSSLFMMSCTSACLKIGATGFRN